MNRRHFITRSAGAIAGAASLSPLWAKHHAAEEAEFTSIFNGVDLTGWEQAQGDLIPKNYRGGRWFVEDGAICGGQTGDGRGSFLRTQEKYDDFELVLDVNPTWGCDSGIWLRTNEKGQCLQVFLDYLDGGNVGFVFGQGSGGWASMPWTLEAVKEGGRVVGVKGVDRYDGAEIDGLLYSAPADEFNAVWKHGEFNTYKIRCEGKHPRVTTWVNGVKMMDFEAESFRGRNLGAMRNQKWDATSAFDKEKFYVMTQGTGNIALQVHPGKQRWHDVSRYKNIRVRRM